MILAAFAFSLSFPLITWALKKCHMPYLSYSLYIGLPILVLGLIFGPIVVLSLNIIGCVVIFMVNADLDKVTKSELKMSAAKEIEGDDMKKQIIQDEYLQYYCLESFTVEQEWEARALIKTLGDNGIWFYWRSGLISSVLIKPDDKMKVFELLKIEPPDDT